MRLGGVAQAAVKFVVTADMVEMGVRGDGLQGAFGDQRDVFAQGHDAHAGIHQHITIAAPDVPDIAAVEFLDMWLVDPCHAI